MGNRFEASSKIPAASRGENEVPRAWCRREMGDLHDSVRILALNGRLMRLLGAHTADLLFTRARVTGKQWIEFKPVSGPRTGRQLEGPRDFGRNRVCAREVERAPPVVRSAAVARHGAH